MDRMRSFGPYIALHLRFEEDMLAFSGCTQDLSPAEADELRVIRYEVLIWWEVLSFYEYSFAYEMPDIFIRTCRENTPYWKEKEINPIEQRSKGYCPLTPKEVGIFLTALGYPSNTPIYLAAGKIYGGDSHMADLRSRFPILMSKVRVVWLASYCCLTHVLDFSILLNHWAPNKDLGMFIVGLLCGHWHLIFQINIGYVWNLDNYSYCCN